LLDFCVPILRPIVGEDGDSQDDSKSRTDISETDSTRGDLIEDIPGAVERFGPEEDPSEQDVEECERATCESCDPERGIGFLSTADLPLADDGKPGAVNPTPDEEIEGKAVP
jgi:hypothetical protein